MRISDWSSDVCSSDLVVAAPDGKRLYVTVGSSSNIAENGLDAEQNRANILEVDPEAKTYRIYAAGMRNPNGVDFDPATGQMWAVVNERDMMGSDLPPEYLTTVALGDFSGWPWLYDRKSTLRNYST